MKKLLTLVILCSFKLIVLAQLPTETVGNPTDSTSVSKYKGWTNQGVLNFSGNAAVQNIQPSNYRGASGGGNVFFVNKAGTTFEVSGFPSDTIDRVEIVYGIYSSDTANPNQLLLEYSKDSVNFLPILDTSNLIYPAATWSTKFASFESHFNVKDLRIRFIQTSATKQFRIDDIRISHYTLLSIKLQQFTSALSGNTVQLFWKASSDSRNETFSVEKSPDGVNFTSLEEQHAKGIGTFNYSFNDPSPLTAVAYYRLKMKNENGSYSYSNVLHVQPRFTSKNILQSVYPLPAKDKLNIQIQSNKTEKAEISVTDVSGKTLITNSISLAEGLNNSVINIQSLAKGIYYLKVVTSQLTETRKIVVGQ